MNNLLTTTVQVYATSLYCRSQTHATHWLMPTVLYTGVDDQCDKLVTETVTHLRRSAVPKI